MKTIIPWVERTLPYVALACLLYATLPAFDPQPWLTWLCVLVISGLCLSYRHRAIRAEQWAAYEREIAEAQHRINAALVRLSSDLNNDEDY